MDDLTKLNEHLSDKNMRVQGQAFRSLIRLGPQAHAAIPELISKLDDPSYAIADMAFVALTHIGEVALGALIEAAQVGAVQRRTLALAALGSNAESIEQVLPVLINALADNDIHIRASAARSIVNLKIYCIRKGLPLTEKLTESANTSREILETITDDHSALVILRDLKKTENNEK